jgi:hypothetical protein
MYDNGLSLAYYTPTPHNDIAFERDGYNQETQF